MKKGTRIIIISLAILFLIWGIFAFIGIFDLVPEAEISFVEATIGEDHNIQWMVLTEFKTEGAFISGKSIRAHIELVKGPENKISFENYEVNIGGSETFLYPKKISNGFFPSPIIELTKSEENKWVGSTEIVFDQPGEFPLYTWIKSPDTIIIGKSSKIINIEPRSTWLSVLQNRRIFALTLILISFGLLNLIIPIKTKN
jgi:hypothetical protein